MSTRLGAIAATLLLVCAGNADAQGLGRFLPNRSGAINGSRGSYLTQVDTAAISSRLGTDRALAFAGESGNSGLHRSLRLPMPQTQARLAALVATLDQGWGDRPRFREPNIHILANRSFEAQAKPDGSIIVSLGLIEKASSDDDLAFILGHELSHIRLGHFADDESLREKRQWVQDIGSNYWSMVAVSQMRLRRSGDEYQPYDSDSANTQSAVAQSVVAYEGLQFLLDVMVGPAWSRSQEDEADALGFDLAQAAHYDASVGSDSAIHKKSADFAVRQEAERHYREQLQHSAALWASEQNQNDLKAGRIENVASSMWGDLMSGSLRRGYQMMTGFLKQEHRTPDARIEMLSRYSNAVPEYATLVPPEEQPMAILNALRGTTEYRAALETTIAIETATALRAEAKYTEAMTALRPALMGRFKDTPVVNNTAARILGASGDITRANTLYWRAHASPDQYLEAFEDHSRMMVEHHRYADARRVIVAGGRNYLATLAPNATPAPGDEEKTFLPQMIMMAFGEHQKELAETYLQRCVAYEEPKLKQACATAAFAPANFAGMSDEERYAAQAEIHGKMTAQAMTPGVLGTLTNLMGRH